MCSTEFDKLTRLVQRQNALSGTTVEPCPPVYLRVLSTLDKALSDEKEKDAKKKMEAAKARALNTMRQKLKKTLKEYEVEYKAFTEDADAYTANFTALTQPEAAPKIKIKKVSKPDIAVEGEQDAEGFSTVGKGGRTYGLGSGDIYKSLAAIQEARGKKVSRHSLRAVRSRSLSLNLGLTRAQIVMRLFAFLSTFMAWPTHPIAGFASS